MDITRNHSPHKRPMISTLQRSSLWKTVDKVCTESEPVTSDQVNILTEVPGPPAAHIFITCVFVAFYLDKHMY